VPDEITVYDNGAEVDPLKAVVFVGVNVAVNDSVPAAANDVWVVAVPVRPVKVTAAGVELMAVVPLKNVTVPAGLPLAAVTVAVRVTVAPAAAELGLADSVVVVFTAAAGVVAVYVVPAAFIVTSMFW
jgi:hypothetical protein